jgi:hypothetical protein
MWQYKEDQHLQKNKKQKIPWENGFLRCLFQELMPYYQTQPKENKQHTLKNLGSKQTNKPFHNETNSW